MMPPELGITVGPQHGDTSSRKLAGEIGVKNVFAVANRIADRALLGPI